MGIDVIELIIVQLFYLEFDNLEKLIYFYINFIGISWYLGDVIGFEIEVFVICDIFCYVKFFVYIICIGQVMGMVVVIFLVGIKG